MTQDQAFAVLTMGKNVFLTGAAGSGKTHLLNRYIRWLRERGVEPAITASTGIAASHIGGQTIHSWSGIGIKDWLSEYDLDFIAQNERLVKRFQKTKVLIIDEVSMLGAHTLGLVDQVIQACVQNGKPFGGMQVVLCGDFFQLPPVVRGGMEVEFAFESEIWAHLGLHVCYLTEQHRQEGGELLDVLNGIRTGHVLPEHKKRIANRMCAAAPEDIPHLYTHNVDVDRLNNERLQRLDGKAKRYEMRTKGSKKRVEAMKKGLLVPEILDVKVGAAVMFVKNHQQGKYVNGTLGVVEGYAGFWPLVRTHRGELVEAAEESWKIEEGEKVKAEITQVPLRLAWAVTVHKSQGMTLDAAYMDLAKTFVPGQGYVALSRVRSLNGLYLADMSELAWARHPEVARIDAKFMHESDAIVRRLERTEPTRLAELSKAFIERIGGMEPAAAAVRAHAGKQTTYDATLALVRKRTPLAKIAKERGLTKSTILGHLEHLRASGTLTEDDVLYLRPQRGMLYEHFAAVAEAFEETGDWKLAPVRTLLGNKFTFDDLRLARLFLKDWTQ